MTIRKKFIALAASGLFLFSNLGAFAEELGYIDVNKIISSYTVAQQAAADFKVKQDDIKKFATNAQKEVQAVKGPDDAKKLEDKYNKMLQDKVGALRQDQNLRTQTIEESIYNAVKTVAAKRKITNVLRKEDLILGGTDLTDEVVLLLNATKK